MRVCAVSPSQMAETTIPGPAAVLPGEQARGSAKFPAPALSRGPGGPPRAQGGLDHALRGILQGSALDGRMRTCPEAGHMPTTLAGTESAPPTRPAASAASANIDVQRVPATPVGTTSRTGRSSAQACTSALACNVTCVGPGNSHL